MPRTKPDAGTMRRKALARWEDEGGASPCGPQAPGVEQDCAGNEPTRRVAAPDDWRAETLAKVRALICEADPDAVETVKWRKPSNPAGVPVWEHDGIICTGETYRDKVKLTFARGASLPDPACLFNASLGTGTRRAIDIREGETIDGGAFKALVRAAAAANRDRAG